MSRSALDHAVYASTAILTRNPDPESTKFPFADDLSNAKGEFRRGARDVPAEIHDFLLAFKPYKTSDQGADNTLWGFNKIRNKKIHRVVAPMAIAPPQFDVGLIGGDLKAGLRLRWEMRFVNRWDIETNQLEIACFRNVQGELDLQFSIDIAFVQTSELPGRPLVTTLRQISGVVEGIVLGIEAETARIMRARPA